MNSIKSALAVFVVLLLIACQATPPMNRGTSGRRLDPTHDSPAELGVRDLRSQDLVTATDRMVQDIASRPDINDPANPPRFFVGTIENRTSRPEQNYQIFLGRLRAQLLASGTRFGLDIRRERDFIERQRAREYGGKDPEKSSEAYQSANEYVLTCVVQDLPAGGTDYFLLEYQLVQLVDQAASGTNVGAGAIVWSGFYEVKYQ